MNAPGQFLFVILLYCDWIVRQRVDKYKLKSSNDALLIGFGEDEEKTY